MSRYVSSILECQYESPERKYPIFKHMPILPSTISQYNVRNDTINTAKATTTDNTSMKNCCCDIKYFIFKQYLCSGANGNYAAA